MILNLPELDWSNLFTQDVIVFLGLCFLLLFGLLTCFIGFRCLKLMMMFLLGCAGGMAGARIAAILTEQKEIHLLFFVLFFFVGWGFIALLSYALTHIGKRLGITDALSAITPIAAALIGAGVVFGVIYGFVYRDAVLVGGICFGLFILGSLLGIVQRRKRRAFFTYEDLLHLPARGEKTNA